MSSSPTVRKLPPRPVVLRELTVVRTTPVTPRMLRVTLGGDQLEGFDSPSPDDHVALFFLADGQPVPTAGPGERPVWATKPPKRDYTPRRHDAERRELDVDVALHGAGIASDWASAARPGTRIAIGGPRGSIVAEGFAHYLLVGDESSLAAMARRVEELPAGTTADVVVEVRDADDEQELTSEADVNVRWLHRGDREPGTTTLLLDAVRETALPADSIYACVAGETDVVRGLRHHLLGERGLVAAHTRFSGYWKRDA